ncbi:hypothetical protein C7N43_32005 [Sphingobacteriales bacterium UPWRP_1]|nr:hypothetical protein BVG80_01355 [Sphingobacteriales bacterium TSM_CSM]PSJ72858.1 hypothetical protein C7N43_32005 [Sphingobacteriales bacterium UPWRP_1]
MLIPAKKQQLFQFLPKIAVFWVKLLIAGLLFYAIYHQLAGKVGKTDVSVVVRRALGGWQVLYLLAAVALVGVNWGIEALKWQRLLLPLERLGFKEALGSVLCGVSFSMLTPNRTGEYGGRILTLRQSNKWQAVTVALSGSFAQLLANVGFSASGFAAFCILFIGVAGQIWVIGVATLLWLFTIALLCFFGQNRLPQTLLQWKKTAFVAPFTVVLQQTSRSTLVMALVLSGLRYLVYLLQYRLLLCAFGVCLTWPQSWMLIGSIFFVQTLVPSVAIAELGIRGNLALYFLGFVTTAQAGVLGAACTLWVLNLALPALAGLVVLVASGNWAWGGRPEAAPVGVKN